MGASGAAGSQAVATDAIARLKPSWTVMVGIAFGIDRDTQKIGDVLVPTEVVLYDNQRVGADRTEIRVGRPTADAMLIARLRAARIDWTTSSVHFGALLSGDDLVDNEEHRDWLLQEAAGGRAIGGEMELSGVFAAAEIHKARWIAAKAICDWAAAKNNRGKAARQRKAARNAALFVRHAVDRGLLASPGD
jgi:nucleoside phosphorylase